VVCLVVKLARRVARAFKSGKGPAPGSGIGIVPIRAMKNSTAPAGAAANTRPAATTFANQRIVRRMTRAWATAQRIATSRFKVAASKTRAAFRGGVDEASRHGFELPSDYRSPILPPCKSSP
jgi:hypothetical protein